MKIPVSELLVRYMERLGIARLADGRAEILEASRLNFAQGAHYLKVMVSGGVTSIKDPIYASQFTDDEVLAAVETAFHDQVEVTVIAPARFASFANCEQRTLGRGNHRRLESADSQNDVIAVKSANFVLPITTFAEQLGSALTERRVSRGMAIVEISAPRSASVCSEAS